MDKTETNDLLEECMLYFKARPVYKKLFLKMRDKYAGLGHFGGTAMLTSLSREEKSQLGGFFQRDYTSNKTITISADLMKKCLESSKFAGLTWELILETYFGEPLQVKKEIELAESKRREDYFAEILESISDESGREWLRSILEEKKEGYLLITQLYKESPEEFYRLLEIYNQYPLTELIIHPRTRKDMYKKTPNWDMYKYAIENSKHKLCYNGDIFTVKDYNNFIKEFPNTNTIMVGRGIISNPALACEIKGIKKLNKDDLYKFYEKMFNDYQEILSGDTPLLHKMFFA